MRIIGGDRKTPINIEHSEIHFKIIWILVYFTYYTFCYFKQFNIIGANYFTTER